MLWQKGISVNIMARKVELPLAKSVYSTYHYQGTAGALMQVNPGLRNWYLNHSLILQCGRGFLHGMTSPFVNVLDSSWENAPGVTKKWYDSEHIKGHINHVIRNLLDDGYYVYYGAADDFYVKGKSWYHEKHFDHDGLICGYDQSAKSFNIYAYDSRWIYRRFDTPQRAFNRARNSAAERGIYCSVCGFKAGTNEEKLDASIIYRRLREYLDSTVEKYPVDGDGDVFGIAVQEYLAMYAGRLYDGSIPYERMDRRVFRLLWEHKAVMLERLQKVEKMLELDHTVSERYKLLVPEADTVRMLYASHHARRRDSLLPVIQKKLYALSASETELLSEFTEKMKGAMKDGALE